MLKLIFTGLMLYLLYRVFFAPAKKENTNRPMEDRQGEDEIVLRRSSRKNDDDSGEYIDYEELD